VCHQRSAALERSSGLGLYRYYGGLFFRWRAHLGGAP
jgi:hypothetical protein